MTGNIKVGIVTYTFGDNYGQRLQNYAVQELLQRRGADASTIRQSEPRCSLKHQVKVFLVDSFAGKRGAKRARHSAFLRFDEEHIKYEPNYSLPDFPPRKSDGFDAFVA